MAWQGMAGHGRAEHGKGGEGRGGEGSRSILAGHKLGDRLPARPWHVRVEGKADRIGGGDSAESEQVGIGGAAQEPIWRSGGGCGGRTSRGGRAETLEP
eukprot:766798-Hanusia_phi.AAC.5